MKIFRARRRPAVLALAATAALGLSAAGAASAAPVHTTAAEAVSAASLPRTALAASSGTVITTATTPFGTALVVGSGPFKGAPLYSITSDHGTAYGCTTQVVHVPGAGPLQCVGPPGTPGKPNPVVDWPAITTSGAPVAAGGVSQSLLATVTRPGVGTQITYAGHPLYMFDGAPAQVTGEGILEASFPPDHGLWNLVATSGKQLPAAGMLTTMQVGGKAVLATPFNVPRLRLDQCTGLLLQRRQQQGRVRERVRGRVAAGDYRGHTGRRARCERVQDQDTRLAVRDADELRRQAVVLLRE